MKRLISLALSIIVVLLSVSVGLTAIAESSSNPSYAMSLGKGYVDGQGRQKYLSDFDSSEMPTCSVGWGSYTRNQTLDGNGTKISLKVSGARQYFDKGVSAHAKSTLVYDLGVHYNEYDYFSAYIGVDYGRISTGSHGSVKFTFSVSNDNSTWTTLDYSDKNKVFTANTEATKIQFNIKGYRYFKIYVDSNGGNEADHSVLADAKFATNTQYIPKTFNILKASYTDENGVAQTADLNEEFLGQWLSKYDYNTIVNNEDLETALLRYYYISKCGYNNLLGILNAAEDEALTNKLNCLEWFLNNTTAMRYFLSGGEPAGNDYIGSFNTLCKLYTEYKDDLAITEKLYTTPDKDITNPTKGDLYLRMIITISITHAQTLNAWMYNNKPSDPILRYKYMKELYLTWKINCEIFENLCIEEMRWVLGSHISDTEIVWLNHYARAHPRNGTGYSYPLLYSPHHHISYKWYNYASDYLYSEDNREKYTQKYMLSGYEQYGLTYGLVNGNKVERLWHVFEEGAVCGNISRTGCNLAAVFGVPAAEVGQPGHCAFFKYERDSSGRGVWGIDNDISGWNGSNYSWRMPANWGTWSNNWGASSYKAGYLITAQAAFNDIANYTKSEEILALLSLAKTNAKKEECYRAALTYIPYHVDAWYGLVTLYTGDSSKTATQLGDLAAEIMSNMTYHPLPMSDLVQIIKTRLNKMLSSASTEEAKLEINNQISRYSLLLQSTLNKALSATSNNSAQPNVVKSIAQNLIGGSSYTLATFSFDGENAGKIVFNSSFTNVRFRYCLNYTDDGVNNEVWNTNVSISSENGKAPAYKLSDEEISAINANNDIYILLEGLTDKKENYFKIDITQASAPSGLYANDNENRLLGTISNMEYSNDDYATWNTLTSNTKFEGKQVVSVRIKNHGTVCGSKTYATYYFTDNQFDEHYSYISIARQSVVDFSSQHTNNACHPNNAIDGLPTTYWHTNNKGTDNDRYMTVKFDKLTYLNGISYVSTQQYGKFIDCNVYVSSDGKSWTLAGSAKGWANDNSQKYLYFDTPVYAQYAKVQCVNGVGGFATANSIEFFEDLTFSGSVPTGLTLEKEPTKKQYMVGDKVDLTGMSVICNYSNGSKVTISADKLTASNGIFTETGEITVDVSYLQLSPVSFKVTVSENTRTATSISLNTNNVKKNYYVGETVDTTGLVVTATDGTNTWYPDEYTANAATYLGLTPYQNFESSTSESVASYFTGGQANGVTFTQELANTGKNGSNGLKLSYNLPYTWSWLNMNAQQEITVPSNAIGMRIWYSVDHDSNFRIAFKDIQLGAWTDIAFVGSKEARTLVSAGTYEATVYFAGTEYDKSKTYKLGFEASGVTDGGPTTNLTIDNIAFISNETYNSAKNFAEVDVNEFENGLLTKTGSIDVAVKHENVSASYQITVSEMPTLSITAEPTKSLYQLSDAFDISGMEVTLTNGSTTTVLELGEYVIDDGDFSLSSGNKEIKIYLAGHPLVCDTVSVTVVDYINVGDFHFEVIGDSVRVCKLNSYNGKGETSVTIPNSVQFNGVSYPVTEIADNAFAYSTDITNLVIPNSITTIGETALSGLTNLKTLTIPATTLSANADSVSVLSCCLTGITLTGNEVSLTKNELTYMESLVAINMPDCTDASNIHLSQEALPNKANCVIYLQTEALGLALCNNYQQQSGTACCFVTGVLSSRYVSVILTAPEKIEYAYLDNIDLAGLKVCVVLDDDSTIYLENDNYSVNISKLEVFGNNTVKVSVNNTNLYGEFVVNVASATPVINNQPNGSSIGDTLTVDASGVKLGYKWYLSSDNKISNDDTLLSCETNTLVTDKEGYYYAVVFETDSQNNIGTKVYSNVVSIINDRPFKNTTTNQTYSSLVDAISNASNNDTIEVCGTGFINATATISDNKTINLVGTNGYSLVRANDFYGTFINVNRGTLNISGLTIDGGAIWSGAINSALKRGTNNTGIKATASLFTVSDASTINLNSGTVIKNADTSAQGAIVSAVVTGTVPYININGAEILNSNCSAAYGGMLYLGSKGKITISDGKFSGNYGAVIATNSGVASPIDINGGIFENNSYTGSYGGVIFIGGASQLNITGGTFKNNVGNLGGVVHLFNTATVNITGGTFSGNSATNGGVIYSAKATEITISNATFSDNSVTNNGGVLFNNNGGNITINSGNFTANRSVNGGVICNVAGDVSVKFNGGTFADNRATNGGVICENGGTTNLNISGGTFSGNIASASGGVIYTSSMTISNASFINNKATESGGAIWGKTAGGSVTITSSTFENNACGLSGNYGYGGALNVQGLLKITDSSFKQNYALRGGAFCNADGYETIITNTSFVSNSANAGMGGAFTVGGKLTVSGANTVFSGNSAVSEGIVNNRNSSAINSFSDCSFENNIISDGSGVIRVSNTVTLTNTEFNGERMFAGSTALKVLNLNYIPTSIAEGSFNGCTALTDVYFSGYYSEFNAIEIGANNESLLNAKIHCALTEDTSGYVASNNTVTVNSFSSNKTEVVIPRTMNALVVSTISTNAFDNCTNVTTIVIPKTVNSLDVATFTNRPNVVISCYEGSYAHQFAVQNGINFSLRLLGDANGDDKLNSLDLVTVRSRLLGVSSAMVNDDAINLDSDCNEDGEFDIRDLVRLKKMIVENIN